MQAARSGSCRQAARSALGSLPIMSGLVKLALVQPDSAMSTTMSGRLN